MHRRSSKGESLLDTINNLSAMHADMFVVRHASSGAPYLIAKHLRAAIACARDQRRRRPSCASHARAARHVHDPPLQEGLHESAVAIVGDILHSRVARSDIHALTTLGVPEVRAIGPRTLLPSGLEQMGVRVFHNIDEGLKDVDVIIMLRLQNERMSGALLPSAQEYFKSWGLTPERLALAKPDAIVMHPGPMNRGVEIESQWPMAAIGDSESGDVRHRGAHGGDGDCRGQLIGGKYVTRCAANIQQTTKAAHEDSRRHADRSGSGHRTAAGCFHRRRARSSRIGNAPADFDADANHRRQRPVVAPGLVDLRRVARAGLTNTRPRSNRKWPRQSRAA
jgi:hypothetical protein